MIRLAFMLLTILTMTFLSPLNNARSVLDVTPVLHVSESRLAAPGHLAVAGHLATGEHLGIGGDAVTAAASAVARETLDGTLATAQALLRPEPTRVSLLRPTIDPPLAPHRPADLR